MTQQDLKFGPTGLPEAEFLSWDVIAQLGSETEAVQECWRRRKNKCSMKKAGLEMGKSKGTVSKYLDGQITMPSDVKAIFQRSVCRNMAITQYEAFVSGYTLAPREFSEEEKREARIRELEAELEKARAAA